MRQGEFGKGYVYIFKPKNSDIGCILHVKLAIDNRYYCIHQRSGAFHSMAIDICLLQNDITDQIKTTAPWSHGQWQQLQWLDFVTNAVLLALHREAGTSQLPCEVLLGYGWQTAWSFDLRVSKVLENMCEVATLKCRVWGLTSNQRWSSWLDDWSGVAVRCVSGSSKSRHQKDVTCFNPKRSSLHIPFLGTLAPMLNYFVM